MVMNDGNGANAPRTLYGIAASPGIVIGRVRHVNGACRTHRHWRLSATEVAAEQGRFQTAVDRAAEELRILRDQLQEDLQEPLAIIDSHLLMLRDRMLCVRALDFIASELVNAEWALEMALARARALFERIEDRYLRERFRDVEHVAERLFRLLAGDATHPLDEVSEKVIVMARDFSPEDTIRMRTDRILGFVTEMGGATSHTAIVARSLGIPSVVGLERVTREVGDNTLVVLDGSTGRLHVNPTKDQLVQFREQQHQYRRYTEEVASYAHLPPVTMDGWQVAVNANIEAVDEVVGAFAYGAGGVGLFRSEYSYLTSRKLPDEESLFAVYRQLLVSCAPLPVTIRTLDIGGDKFASAVRWGGEANPALGLRSIRFSLREPAIFETQLRAILRAGVYGNLRLLFPMISSRDEVRRIKEIVERVKEGLRREGVPFGESVPLGIMVEVPSAVALADALALEVDFFSIGTNDLIQYALAIDRVNEYVAHMYDPLHPAVLRMIRQVVEAGHAAGIEVGLCGEMAGDVTCLPLLLGFGVDELSMHPVAIPYVKRMIRQSTIGEVRDLVATVARCSSSLEVRGHLAAFLPQRYPEEFDAGSVLRRRRLVR